MKKTRLREYARLIARAGVNVQKGQEVFITASLDQPEFVRMVAEECYRAKASRVVIDWTDTGLDRLDYRYRTVKNLGMVTDYEETRWKHYSEVLPARIYLDSDDPDGMAGIDPKKVARVRQLRYPIIKPYRDAMENKYQWCIAAVPGKAWAKKLFPDLRAAAAEEKLWEAILATCRVNGEATAAWKAHNADMKARCDRLNSLRIKSLHYTSSNGTDLTVGMIPEGMFCGGSEDTIGGVTFNPNMPTEECFTTPMKGQAEGWVVSTMPLSYNGQLIENFKIRFEGGKAVEWHAEKNEALLGEIIRMDETSGYLGECALVPVHSPVAETGILFYNTLFDENAACHLALGEGFPDCIRGFEKLTLEEVHALGVNDSMVHIDFMIGCEDLAIDALCEDGTVVPVFVNGTWAE